MVAPSLTGTVAIKNVTSAAMRASVAPEPHFSVDDERNALLVDSGGWWRPISYWRATYEPPPPKKKKKDKEPPKKTAAQLEKEKQKTLRRLGWIVDKIADKIWIALLEALPEISSDFLGDACAVAREQQASASGADAEFFNCFARLTNCLAAMDATMRFETTARRKHTPCCCGLLPSCTKYPKPDHFSHARMAAAPTLHAALQGMMAHAQVGCATSAVEMLAELSTQLAGILSRVSATAEGASSNFESLTQRAQKIMTSPLVQAAIATLKSGADKTSRASLEKVASGQGAVIEGAGVVRQISGAVKLSARNGGTSEEAELAAAEAKAAVERAAVEQAEAVEAGVVAAKERAEAIAASAALAAAARATAEAKAAAATAMVTLVAARRAAAEASSDVDTQAAETAVAAATLAVDEAAVVVEAAEAAEAAASEVAEKEAAEASEAVAREATEKAEAVAAAEVAKVASKKAVSKAAQAQLDGLLELLGGDDANEANLEMPRMIVETIKDALINAVREKIIKTVAKALFGKSHPRVAEAAVRAVGERLLAATAQSTAEEIAAEGVAGLHHVSDEARRASAALEKAKRSAAEAEAAFKTVSDGLMSPQLGTPEELRLQYEAEADLVVAELARHKAQLVVDIKRYLATKL